MSSLQGVSLAASSAPKSAQNSILFRSQNFERTDFWLRKAKTEVILVGLPSILTQRKRKSVSQNRSSDYSLSVRLTGAESDMPCDWKTIILLMSENRFCAAALRRDNCRLLFLTRCVILGDINGLTEGAERLFRLCAVLTSEGIEN